MSQVTSVAITDSKDANEEESGRNTIDSFSENILRLVGSDKQ